MSANNFASNQPIEIGQVPFNSGSRPQLQLVIARRSVPTAPVPATTLRYVLTSVAGTSGILRLQDADHLRA